MGRWILLLVGALVCAAAMMGWGFGFWTALPLPWEMMKPLPRGESLAQEIKSAIPEEGVYLYPGEPPTPDGPNFDAWAEKHRQGPILQLFYRPKGIEPMQPQMFLQGGIHFFVSALLAGMLLKWASCALTNYFARAGYGFAIGMFAVVLLNFSNPIWFYHPWKFYLFQSVYDLGNALIIGVIMSMFVWPPKDK